MRPQLVGLLALSPIAIACSATGTTADSSSAEQTQTATADTPAYYVCSTAGDDSDTDPVGSALDVFEIGVLATTIELTDLSPHALVPDLGEIDPTVFLAGGYHGGLGFTGFEVALEGVSGWQRLEVSVDRAIRERRPNGYVRIVARRSGREATAHAHCHARRQKLGVDLAKAARLRCTFDDWLGMYGVSWDTTGSTLWASTGSLVQTGADAGVLGVDYSEFRAERRGSLSRTTTEITGSFGEYEVALRYRAGSTYLGTISDASSLCTTPGPRKIRCQDDAMVQLTAEP